MRVDIQDIIDAFELTDQYTECFLDTETGNIERINEMVMTQKEKQEIIDRLDEHGSYRLPSSRDLDDYSIMESFIDSLSGKAHDRLADAISGRGAFRRFKDALYEMGIEKEWFSFKKAEYRKIAIRWCEDAGIQYKC